jgi:chromosome segregation ATPase
LSTQKPIQPVPPVVLPPVQTPPQAELLATEYVHNLQQQLYFLKSELRFLNDRAGTDAGAEGLSVDATIRRLRIASATHEEETNKTVQELEKQIAELRQSYDLISEEQAIATLKGADQRERDGLEHLEKAYVEMSSDILFRQRARTVDEAHEGFHQTQRESMSQGIREKEAEFTNEQHAVRDIEERLDRLRKVKKQSQAQLKESIKTKRFMEEEADVLTLLSNEPERPPENVPLPTIKAKNAKIELELKAALASRNEIEQQVDLLLEKNIKLKAELNRVNRDLETAKYLQDNMNRMYSARWNAAKKVSDDQLAEITSLKRIRKEMKREMADLTKLLNQAADQISQCQIQEQYHQAVTAFQLAQKATLDDENDKTKKEIHAISDRILGHRENLEKLAHDIAEAGERQKSVAVLVKINDEDPRCTLNDPPPELAELLHSLTAVKDAML